MDMVRRGVANQTKEPVNPPPATVDKRRSTADPGRDTSDSNRRNRESPAAQTKNAKEVAAHVTNVAEVAAHAESAAGVAAHAENVAEVAARAGRETVRKCLLRDDLARTVASSAPPRHTGPGLAKPSAVVAAYGPTMEASASAAVTGQELAPTAIVDTMSGHVSSCYEVMHLGLLAGPQRLWRHLPLLSNP